MFNKDENIITQVSNLKLLVSSKVDSIIKEAEETQLTLNNANNIIKDLESKLKAVEAKYSNLIHDYNKTLEAYEITKSSATTAATPSTVIPFDSAIHSHKPMRPITKAVRDQILAAYERVYKKDEDCKTLTEFYKWIQDNIHASISRSEIEGVLYNRFDERLYQ